MLKEENMKINQFHSGTVAGDAITNQMFFIRDILRGEGYCSEIFAEFVAPELSQEITSINNYEGDDESILIIHHSMGIGTEVFDKIVNLPDKKVLIYHNITPEEFFDDMGTKLAIRRGHEQLEKYKSYLCHVVADSNYNRRQLLERGYSCNIDILPVHVSLDRFDKCDIVETLKEKYADTCNILFVGRLVWNKRQLDLIKAFSVYKKYYNSNSRLFIVGDDSMQGYVSDLKSLASECGIAESVIITGKVSEEELKTYYELADVFVSMSEHEGFGVPLLEAMKMGVPVLAYRSSAVAETMNGAGILFTEKNYALIGTLIDEVVSNKGLYNAIVDRQYEEINNLVNSNTKQILDNIINQILCGKRKKQIQLQGPFETSYSLAIVNRKLIEAIDDNGRYDVSIHCTEGPGDYEPQTKDLANIPHAAELWMKSKDVYKPDIIIRNMYPPRVSDVNGGLNFQAFGWEESIIPEEYINDFNKYLDGIGTTSDYVTEKLIECGIKIPVKTMGNGVDLPENYNDLQPYVINTKKKTKFLHISSAFKRKGVDILIKGFCEAFSTRDDVCLVLKTFPNPHNSVEQLLKEAEVEYPNHGEIIWINEDMSENEIFGLYKACDCYVQVARGEGFGLPVAEAMLARVPVIVSPNSGMADFCNEENSLLVDYNIALADTHLTSNGKSMWFEPYVDSLKKQLLYFVNNDDKDACDLRVENAYRLIKNEFSWRAVADRWERFIEDIENKKYRPSVAMVTTWNTKCGIAEYTKMAVLNTMHCVEYEVYPNSTELLICDDEEYVKERVWRDINDKDINVLIANLKASKCSIVHFQFNYGFFDLHNLEVAINELFGIKKIVITFHKTQEVEYCGRKLCLQDISDALNKCTKIIVHQKDDKDRLLSYGIKEDIIIEMSLGQIVYGEVPSSIAKKRLGIHEKTIVIGSYGFLLPHKGIDEIIRAIPLLKKKYDKVMFIPVCSIYDAQESRDYYEYCKKVADELGVADSVRFETDFLDNDDSISLLQASDVMVIPYRQTGESASGSVRFCLASLRPTITTNRKIFAEFKDCTYQIDETDSVLIAEAIEHILTDGNGMKYVDATKAYLYNKSWNRISEKYLDMYVECLA